MNGCKHYLRAATVMGIAAWLGGCAQAPWVSGNPPLVVQCVPPNPGARPGTALVGQQYGMQHSPLPVNSVQFDSQVTASQIAVQGLYASRSPTDTVEVAARLVSCIDAPQMVRARTHFLRDNQSPAEPTSIWREVQVPARAI